MSLIFATVRDREAVLFRKYKKLAGLIIKQTSQERTCNFSSLFPLDELELALLFDNSGDPGAMHDGAETSRSQ